VYGGYEIMDEWCSCIDCDACMDMGMAYPECYEAIYYEEMNWYGFYGY
jgi:hypothetical protein